MPRASAQNVSGASTAAPRGRAAIDVQSVLRLRSSISTPLQNQISAIPWVEHELVPTLRSDDIVRASAWVLTAEE